MYFSHKNKKQLMSNIRWNKDFLLSFADSHIIGLQKRPLSSSKKEDILISNLLLKAKAHLKKANVRLKTNEFLAQLEQNLVQWELLHNALAKEPNPLLLEEKRLLSLKIDKLRREFCKEWKADNIDKQ